MSDETPVNRKEIKAYNRIKIALTVTSMAIGVAYLMVILISGFAARSADWVRGVTAQPYLGFLLFVLILGGLESLLTMPLQFYGGFIVEHRFGLSTQSFGRWCWEAAKGMLVGLALMTPLLLAFFLFLRTWPVYWWIPVSGVYFLFSVILAQLGPVLIFPLFYKFSDVEDESLKASLRRLSEEAGVTVSNILSFNLSKNTKKANAAFTGLGRTRRILLADTLLEQFTSKEIETVIGHELGHNRHGHLWKGILLGMVLSFGGLFTAGALYRLWMDAFGSVRGDELSPLPLLALLLAGFGLVAMPVQNAVSRRFERQADRFTVNATGNRTAFILALEKLGKINKADDDPHPLAAFFLYSHPPLKKRIDYIQRAATPCEDSASSSS